MLALAARRGWLRGKLGGWWWLSRMGDGSPATDARPSACAASGTASSPGF